MFVLIYFNHIRPIPGECDRYTVDLGWCRAVTTIKNPIGFVPMMCAVKCVNATPVNVLLLST